MRAYESNRLGDDYGSDDSNFQYRYMVSDPLTGDAKSQHETRRGDAVTGEYRVLEANGLMRVVSYTADDAHGFVAHVRWEPAERPHGPAVSHQEVSQQHSH
ncbi:Pupal cuticle protein Edg-84A [Amphibalanus amphitrite]|uniref:Pupal cuticle protein Edg-84A n=1 Tax=Amphibalanus amphitrite TaxID=1232801 RepID=A0A6A4V2G2_AMPAM|nr:Pupal cuticle protein Edg-84A [Amphibalanus amphitrite]